MFNCVNIHALNRKYGPYADDKEAQEIADILNVNLAREKELDAPIKSDKWKNLSFDTHGNSHMGVSIFSSEIAAANCAIAAEVDADYYLNTFGQDTLWDCLDSTYLHSDHSHTIQIPWREDNAES